MGGKSTTSTQTVSIPPEVLARYNAVNARAEETAKQPFQQYGSQFVAPLTPTQQAGVQATSAASQLAQPFYGAATGLTLAGAQDVGPLTQGQIGYYENPYTAAVAAPTYQALRQQQGQELAQQQANAIRSGAAFGQRSGLERANLMRQQALGTAQALAPIFQQGYGQAVQTAAGQQNVIAQDLARRMQAGQAIGGLGAAAQQAALQGAQAQLQAGTAEQQTQQADLTARYQQFLQERGYPFQVAQFLANIAMGTGALSGSTTTTTQPAGIFSDERMKHDAKRVGYTDDGLPIYTFKYNNDDKTHMGVMAQDVEKKHPEAVGLAPASDGHMYKTVDYEKVGEKERAYGGGLDANSMGGAVYEGGDYARGGSLGGGLLPDSEIRAIQSGMRRPAAVYEQAGLYSSTPYQTPYGTGLGIRGDAVPVPGLVLPARISAPESPIKQAMSTYQTIKGLGEMGKGLYEGGEKALFGSAEQLGPKGEVIKKATSGLRGAGGKYDPEKSIFGFAEGGLAEQDELPYGSGAMSGNEDIMADVVKSGAGQVRSLPKPGEAPKAPDNAKDLLGLASMGKSAISGFGNLSSGLGSLGSALGAGEAAAGAASAAGAAGGLGSALGSIGTGIMEVAPMLLAFLSSDERVKHNKEKVGELYDGQPVYRYDYGDGVTQLGLMAQNVEKRHPEAVMEHKGLKYVNYDRATEDAVHKYAGGLVSGRDGYQRGGGGGLDLDPEDLAIRTIAAETGGDPDETKGIAAVIKNRLESGRYGSGLGDVILARGQFEPWSKPDAPNYPMRFQPGSPRYESAKAAWEAVKQGDDPTGGATHFWAPAAQSALGRAAPSWGREGGLDIGATRFHRVADGGIGNRVSMYTPQTGLGQAEASQAIDRATERPSEAAKSSGLSAFIPTKKNAAGEEVTDYKKILVPLLTGIAGMAAAPTRNFPTALAIGLGAGAQSFSDLEKKEADIAFRNAETGKLTQETQLQLLDRLNSINAVRQAKNLPLIRSVEEYLRRIKDGTIYDATATEKQPPNTASGTVTGNPVKQNNQPGAPDTVAGNTGEEKQPGNVNVGQDLAGIDWSQIAPSNNLPAMQAELETTQRMMALPSLTTEQYIDLQKKSSELAARIEGLSKQDYLLTRTGEKIVPKSWAEFKQYQQNLPKINEMMNQGSQAYNARQQGRYQLENISRAFEVLKTGSFTDIKTQFAAAMEAAGFPVSPDDLANVTAAQTAVKNAWDRIFARLGEVGGQVRVLEIQGLQKANPDINLQPGANRNLIASGIAALDYEDKYYNDMVAAKNRLGSKFDPATFTTEWQKENKDLLRQLSDEARKKTALRGDVPRRSNGMINEGELKVDHSYILEPGMGIPGITKPTKVKYLGLDDQRRPRYEKVD